jgi:hypothetical protein
MNVLIVCVCVCVCVYARIYMIDRWRCVCVCVLFGFVLFCFFAMQRSMWKLQQNTRHSTHTRARQTPQPTHKVVEEGLAESGGGGSVGEESRQRGDDHMHVQDLRPDGDANVGRLAGTEHTVGKVCQREIAVSRHLHPGGFLAYSAIGHDDVRRRGCTCVGDQRVGVREREAKHPGDRRRKPP